MKTICARGSVVFLVIIVTGVVFCCSPVACFAICIKELIEKQPIETIDILKYIFIAIGGIALLACGIYVISSFLKRKIVLNDEYIYAPSDLKKSNLLLNKIQHETTIRYDEIQSARLEMRSTDTKDKPIPRCVTPMINLIFVCLDGSIKAINLHLYGNKQIAFLIDCVRDRVKQTNGKIITDMTGRELLEAFKKSQNEKFRKKKG